MTTGRRPPVTETRKVLAAARPPTGPGPSTSAVLRGWARVAPPLPVVVAAALMTLVPLALLAVAARYAVGFAGKDWPLVGKVVGGVLLCGVLVMLAALAHRGTKRVVHLGSFAEGFFPARLLTIGCVVTGLFLVKYVLVDGEPTDPTMVVPFLALAVAWAPWPVLLLPSAQAWPHRVRLRWARPARDADEALLLAHLVAPRCPAGVAAWPCAVDPVRAETGAGWRVRGVCPACGTVLDVTLRAADGAREGVGGGDLHALVRRLAPVAGEPPAAVRDDVQLDLLRYRSAVGVEVHRRLLELVPDGHDVVPGRRRTGTPVPLMVPAAAFGRDALEQGRELHRALLVGAEEEQARRRGPA